MAIQPANDSIIAAAGYEHAFLWSKQRFKPTLAPSDIPELALVAGERVVNRLETALGPQDR